MLWEIYVVSEAGKRTWYHWNTWKTFIHLKNESLPHTCHRPQRWKGLTMKQSFQILALNIQKENPASVSILFIFLFYQFLHVERKMTNLPSSTGTEECYQLSWPCATPLLPASLQESAKFLWDSSYVIWWSFYTESTVGSVFTTTYSFESKTISNSSVAHMVLQINLPANSSPPKWMNRDRCHKRIQRHVFMLCNTYLGMVLMKAYEKEWRGERNKINREDGYKRKRYVLKSNCLIHKITWV